MKPEESKLEKGYIEKILGEPITDFTTTSGSKEGDNVAGNLLCLKVTTKAGEKHNLVYKSFPTIGNEEQKQFLIQFGVFRTETCVYEKLFPRIKELLEKRKSVTNKELPSPKYISGMNDDMNDYLCMEDLRPRGFVMQDKYHSLTFAETSMVMKEMARLHALTYFLLQYDGEKMFEEDDGMRRLKYNSFSVENPLTAELFPRMFVGHVENTIELLEPRDKALAERVRKFAANHDFRDYRKLQRFNMNRTDKDIFACIVHGDLWTNNIMFSYSEAGNRDKPSKVKFIDFQQTRRGCIFEDLGYFFWTSTTPDFRKAHLHTMLSTYYDSFTDTMGQLEFPIPVGFTRGQLVDGFYQGMLAAYIYMPFALSLQMGNLKFMKADDLDEKKENGHANEPPNGPPGPPDLNKMIADDKKLSMLRMMHSPRALERLEILTREAVELKLL